VPHHLIDVVDPDEDFSAAEYARRARASLADIAGRGRRPFVVGGTGLYLRALLEGLFEGPSRDEDYRRRLMALAERHGDARLHRLLARVDPSSAARIHARDRVRVVRALEVFRATGRPLSGHHQDRAEPLRGFRTFLLGIAPEREVLRARVEARTTHMLEAGLLDEVRGLLGKGYSPELRPLRAIGYRQAVAVIQGKTSLARARHDIVTETMRYAKRQMTWFRRQAEVCWSGNEEDAYGVAMAFLEGK
jgi:tRNA dimethylallyltransferase